LGREAEEAAHMAAGSEMRHNTAIAAILFIDFRLLGYD
jgi:hypothetical protein